MFDPLIIHQGSSCGNRLDFHMKFCNSKDIAHKKNDFQDFSVIDILHEEYELNFDSLLRINNIPLHKRSSFFNRLITSIDYRTCLRRSLKIFFLKNHSSYKALKESKWDLDHFSNTILQDFLI